MPKNDLVFESNKKISVVTPKIKVKKFTSIDLINSPSLNDPNQERNDNEVFKNICEDILENVFKKNGKGY